MLAIVVGGFIARANSGRAAALHQSKPLASEFKICKNFDLEIRGAPSVHGPTLGVHSKSSDFVKFKGNSPTRLECNKSMNNIPIKEIYVLCF